MPTFNNPQLVISGMGTIYIADIAADNITMLEKQAVPKASFLKAIAEYMQAHHHDNAMIIRQNGKEICRVELIPQETEEKKPKKTE